MNRRPALFAILLLAVPLWAVTYLPMADFSVHAGQLQTWLRLATHDPIAQQTYSINWLTPYLGGYALAFLFAQVLPAALAVKLVITLALVGAMLAAMHLLREARAPQLAIFALVPIAFNQTFYWGLFNHLVAIPFALLAVARTYAYAREPSRRIALQLVALGVALLACHVIVLALACGACLLVLVAERAPLRRIWPLLVAWPPAIAWMAMTRAQSTVASEAPDWRLGTHRLRELVLDVFGLWGQPDWVRVGAALLLLALVVWGIRLRSPRHLLVPALPIVIYLFAPYRMFGTACLNARAAAFVLPLLFCAFEGRDAPMRRAWISAGLVAVSLALLTLRFVDIDAVAHELDPILQQMAPAKRALALVFRSVEPSVQSPIHEHALDWYVATGGIVDPSAAATKYQMMIRYRPGVSKIPSEWSPKELRFDEVGWYDYYAVRAPKHHPTQVFGPAASRVSLVAQNGSWWLYVPTGSTSPLR